MLSRSAAAALFFGGIASAGSLTDVKHVVLFMQENRAFDHVSQPSYLLSYRQSRSDVQQYFGTMAGVRGFADPNVQVNADGYNTFQQ
jgi:phospholipase C